MAMDVVDYEIKGAEMQFVEVELDPGEAAIGEAGSMMFMDAGIGMDTVFGDGSANQGGFFGKLLGAGKRLVTGESLFTTIYTNQPYAAFVPAACDSKQHPNGDDADATINVVSHEHNEAITDPQLNAWYDNSGAEIGDKCAWNFGVSLGRTAFGNYNQIIGTGKYYVQQEWSNAHRGCVLRGT